MYTCNVCAEDSKKPLISCHACEFEACVICHKRFLLDVSSPQCMSCREDWPHAFLCMRFPGTFINGPLKKHRANILFDIEVSRLPEVQEEARLQRVVDEVDDRLKVLRAEEKHANDFLKKVRDVFYYSSEGPFRNMQMAHENGLCSCVHFIGCSSRMSARECSGIHCFPCVTCRSKAMYASLVKDTLEVFPFLETHSLSPESVHRTIKTNMPQCARVQDEWSDTMKRLKLEIRDVKHTVKDAKSKLKEVSYDTATPTFTSRCPKNTCNGFVSHGTCGLCDAKICVHCEEIKNDPHACDPEKVKTVKFIKSDTKPCPKCSTLIHKIHGCDQMFCTVCKVTFSWNSGCIQTRGTFHNPHYFDWLFSPQGGGVGQADGMLVLYMTDVAPRFDSVELNLSAPSMYSRTADVHHVVRDMFTAIGECEQAPPNEPDNKDIRIRYMNQRITEETFKKTLVKREKEFNMRSELHRILTGFGIAMNQTMTNLVMTLSSMYVTADARDVYLTAFREILDTYKKALKENTSTLRRYKSTAIAYDLPILSLHGLAL